MKKRVAIVAVAMAVQAMMAVKPAQAQTRGEGFQPVLVSHEPSHVFTPFGFDDNDNAQIVLAGEYPNTCYKVGPVAVRVDEQKRRILIRNGAYLYESCWCAQVMVPYVQSVDLGPVAAGEYDVAVENEDGKIVRAGQLKVSISTNEGPDDHLYAPVDQLDVQLPSGGNPPALVLRGTLTNTCMRVVGVKTFYRPGNVIEVLPVAEYREGRDCEKARRPFEMSVVLKDAARGKTLIHVRSLNGQAINRVVDF